MKTLFTILVLFISAKSLAHVCHISLYDPYNRPYLNVYSTQDPDCQQAANTCYRKISERRLDPNYYRCYTISMTNDPLVSQPQTRPQNRPQNNPSTIEPIDTDYQRGIEMGETVIYEGKLWLVSSSRNGFHDLIPEGGKKKDKVEGISRRQIAITRGCLRNICTKTSVISRLTRSYMAVKGIDFRGRYILKNVANKELTFDVDFMYLIKTEGCVNDVCVGKTVQDRYNQYFEVVGMQADGLVVIKDERQKLSFSVDPRELIATN